MPEYMPNNTGNNANDALTILESLNPGKEIHSICLSYLGLDVRTTRDGTKVSDVIKRYSRPSFTEEWVLTQLRTDLLQLVSYTVQFSVHKPERILQRIGEWKLTFLTNLATHGDDNYISNRSWQKILDIHESAPDPKVESGWAKFGINWKYDAAVTYDMLQLVKDRDEDADQTVNFNSMMEAIGTFVEASMNKSVKVQESFGMLLEALKNMYKQNQSINYNPDPYMHNNDQNQQGAWR